MWKAPKHEAIDNLLSDPKPPPPYDLTLISIIRKMMPQIIAQEILGVQPMTGPTGLIFTMKHAYRSGPNYQALEDILI